MTRKDGFEPARGLDRGQQGLTDRQREVLVSVWRSTLPGHARFGVTRQARALGCSDTTVRLALMALRRRRLVTWTETHGARGSQYEASYEVTDYGLETLVRQGLVSSATAGTGGTPDGTEG